MERSSTSVENHLASLPEPTRADLVELDSKIAEVLAGQERVLWEGTFWGGSAQRIIGYGSYRYLNRSGTEVDWFIVGLAAQKNYLSLYVNASEDGAYLIKRYVDRLGKVKAGSANVTFKRLADVEVGVVLEMVARAGELMGDQSRASG